MRILEINSEALGVSTLQLMENAGKAVKDEILSRIKLTPDSKIFVFIGHGGKGGDGAVVARHFAAEGYEVTVFLFGENKHRDAMINISALEEMDYSINLIRVEDVIELEPVEGDVLVDAMLGIGFKGKLREPFRTAIKIFNQSKGFKVSIDVPSGIDANTGEFYEDYVKPDLVVTFHDIKTGLIKYNFNIVVKNIGIPKEAEIYAGPGDVLIKVKKKQMRSKKGDYGRVLVIGGSYIYAGAPAFAGLAALRTGADLVYVAAPEDTAKIISSFSPNLITIKVKGKNFSEENFEELRGWIEKADSIVIGSGMGLEESTINFIKTIIAYIKEKNKPIVIDADALKSIRGWKLYKRAVITPHAGEFQIFFNEKVPDDPANRINKVKEKAKSCECIVLLKGYFDIISDGDRLKLNKTGNPGMTVGGTGDSLAGIVGTLLAQGLDAFDAAYIGSFINGLAGSLAYQNRGDRILTTDLIEMIPFVIKDPLQSFKSKVYKRVLY